MQWHRADTTLEYLSTSRFSITEQNAKKLQDEINKYDWGEHDTPIVDFNDESTIRKIAYFFLSIPYRIISFLHII